MYRLNPLNREVLITSDEVLAKAPVDNNADPRLLINTIEIAEERFIVPILGDALYEDLCALKNVTVTANNKATLESKFPAGTTLKEGQIVNAIEEVSDEWYQKLWNRFLWKIVAECVAYSIIPSNAVRTTAKGEMQNNPAGPMGSQEAASVSLSYLKFKMDKVLQDRIDPLIASMEKWLCTNKTNFPKYDSTRCPCDDQPRRKMTGFVHGVYDDEDNNCSCSN